MGWRRRPGKDPLSFLFRKGKGSILVNAGLLAQAVKQDVPPDVIFSVDAR